MKNIKLCIIYCIDCVDKLRKNYLFLNNEYNLVNNSIPKLLISSIQNPNVRDILL